MIIFNWLGLGMSVIGFGAAYIAGYFLGTFEEGVLMIVAGPIISFLDLLYRFKSKDCKFWIHHKGGSLFFLPAWCLGILWLALGIYYTVQGAL